MKIRNCLFFVTLIAAILILTSCVNEPEQHTYDISDSFSGIRVEIDAADLNILPTTGGARVICKGNFAVEVKVGVLQVVETNEPEDWLEKIFTKNDYEATIYLPEAEYETLVVYCDTGDVDIDDVKAKATTVVVDTGDVELSGLTSDTITASGDTGKMKLSGIDCASLKAENDTGKIEITNARAEHMSIEADTGDIKLDSVIATGKLTISVNTGDVNFRDCDGGEVYITANTGDVKGSFLTDKIIFAESDTGKISIPKLTSGGKCEITTNTGDIIITVGE